MGKISVIVSDITQLQVDVIVNAANESLLGGGGVDGAIHAAAGPELLAFNRTLGGCQTGEAKLSPGFNLPATHIIHTVGPVWSGGNHHEHELLEQAYESVFQIARKLGCGIKIAFPAISTGVYHFPKAEAAEIAVSVMRLYQEDFDEIIACCHTAADTEYYCTALELT